METHAQQALQNFTVVQGAVVRGDSTQKKLALVFTADETAEGLPQIRKTLKETGVKGSFFFTGRFYRNSRFKKETKKLRKEGHYLGPHSDQHLLYCDWNKRDSLLVTKDSFAHDIARNLATMTAENFPVFSPHYFIPPYEWWNDFIAAWSQEQGLQLFNFTPGIRTNADYTWPGLGAAYKSSDWLLQWLKETLATQPQKFNGAIVLIHAGTDERRTDKFYNKLTEVIRLFKAKQFQLKRIDELLKETKPAS